MLNDKKIDLFLFLNFFCNDNCKFCFFANSSSIKKKEIFLKLNDVKKILKDLDKNIRCIVLTGGEPTLNPDFWKIIDYIYHTYIKHERIKGFDLSTNTITSANKKNAKKIEKYFSSFNKNYSDIKISFSLSDFNNNSLIDKKKITGIKNLMKINSNIKSVIVITKKNVKKIVSMTEFLIDLYKKRQSEEYFFKIDYRLPYISQIRRLTNFNKIVPDFDNFIKAINKSLILVGKENIWTTLHNIPLCYLNLKNYQNHFISKHPPCGVGVMPIKNNINIENIKFKFGKMTKCKKCSLFNHCNGIEEIYLKKYKYGKLNPL